VDNTLPSPLGCIVRARQDLTKGFTLIEVMVVVVIIAVLINFAVLTMGKSTYTDQLKEEAERFNSLVELASEEAMLRSVVIGVDITEESYSFLKLDEEKKWEAVSDNLFRERTLPETVELSIEVALPEGDEEEKRTPEIILLNSGEMTPFELKISSQEIDSYYLLTGNEIGELTLKHEPSN
jgi:general secretion pathway protein H